MPSSADFTGLTRTVIQYSEAFSGLVAKAKDTRLVDADWQPIEQIVDTAAFERQGVFATPEAEKFGWSTYKGYISEYGGGTSWEGTLRHVTEQAGRVILELEERNSRGGVTNIANTVTIYEFNGAGKIKHLEVYVMPLNGVDLAAGAEA